MQHPQVMLGVFNRAMVRCHQSTSRRPCGEAVGSCQQPCTTRTPGLGSALPVVANVDADGARAVWRQRGAFDAVITAVVRDHASGGVKGTIAQCGEVVRVSLDTADGRRSV
jgi:hypothetical protein